tara:strand:- start:4640 stop:5083 length:444 start_codon:yes stop_codon:yes gene_type:complete
MSWTVTKENDGMIKYAETPSAVTDGSAGYSSEFSLKGMDSIQVLTNEVSNSTVTLEVLKSGRNVTVGGVGEDPSAALTDAAVWTAIGIDSGAIADNAIDLKMLSNASKGRLKIAASGGDVTQALVFYAKGTLSGAGFSISGIGSDPS